MKDLPSPFLRLTDRDIADRVVSFRNVAGQPAELRRALTDPERTALERRAAELRAALALAPAASRDRIVDALLSIQPAGFDYETSVAAATAYLRNLEDRTADYAHFRLPEWAIMEACRQICTAGVRAETGTTLEQTLHITIRALLATFEKRLGEIEGLLGAKVDTAPSRAPSGHLAPIAPPRGDGRHAQRVAADLEERKARNTARQQEGEHP